MNDWLDKLRVLTEAQHTWHQYTLPEWVHPVKVKEVLESDNIGRYIWNTQDLHNDNYWNSPIRSHSAAKIIYFEDKNDIIMFNLLWS